MNKTTLCLFLIVILAQPPIYAEEFVMEKPVKMTLEEKREDADLIVKGKVESVSLKNGENKTDYCGHPTARIRIQEIIKGKAINHFVEGQYLCCPKAKIGACYKMGDEDTFYLSLTAKGKVQGKEDYTIIY